jgi:hypothetical protein
METYGKNSPPESKNSWCNVMHAICSAMSAARYRDQNCEVLGTQCMRAISKAMAENEEDSGVLAFGVKALVALSLGSDNNMTYFLQQQHGPRMLVKYMYMHVRDQEFVDKRDREFIITCMYGCFPSIWTRACVTAAWYMS